MNEIKDKKVSPPFEGGVVGTIDYLRYTVFYFPTGVVDSLISSYLYWYEKQEPLFNILKSKKPSKEKIRILNKQSTTPAGISICIIIKKWSGHPSFKRRGNVIVLNPIFYIQFWRLCLGGTNSVF
jgi:hypothetical protein